jgi:hypothetical protein
MINYIRSRCQLRFINILTAFSTIVSPQCTPLVKNHVTVIFPVQVGLLNLEIPRTFVAVVKFVMLIIDLPRNLMHFPLDPTADYSGVQINVVATRTFLLVVLKGHTLPHDNTHFENQPRFHRTGEFQTTDLLAVFGVYHLIVTLLHVATS